MWPSLCCGAQRTSSRSNLNGVEQGEQDGTVAIQHDARASQQASSSQENKVGMNFPALESQKLRHRVKLELPPRPQSMGNTLEQRARSETFSPFDRVTHDVIQNPSTGASNTSLDSDYKTPPSTIAGDTSLPRNYPDVTPKHQSLVTSTGGSSESVYKTPPTSRHPSASSHPLNTMKSASRLNSTSKNSSLTRETVPTREKRSSQALLCKMEESEQKRQQQQGMNFPALESQKLRHSVKLELPPRPQSMGNTLEQRARSETFSPFDRVTHDVIQNPSTGASNTS